jgi:HK97 family phage prohead protease
MVGISAMMEIRFGCKGLFFVTLPQFLERDMAKTEKGAERELPEKLEHDFMIADESVNRNGWRLRIAGLRTDAFEKNPVCVIQHNQWMIPVGRWTSLTKEKGVLKGRLEFDRNDAEAVRLYWKYADGFMNAVSLSIMPLKESEDREDVLPGQRRATVTESELMEISLVTIPAYGNSVKLCYADGKEYEASLLTDTLYNSEMEKNEKTVEQLQAELAAQKQLNAENLIKYHTFRGVVTAGEAEPLKKLAQSDYASTSAMLEARTPATAVAGEAKDTDPRAELADGLVNLHAGRGAITEAEKPAYRAAALADYEGTKKLLESKAGTQQAKDFVSGMSAQKQADANDRDAWTYLDWYKKDLSGLQAMAKSDPERHKKLEADFQAKCVQDGIVY